jgi:hypothetical protein
MHPSVRSLLAALMPAGSAATAGSDSPPPLVAPQVADGSITKDESGVTIRARSTVSGVRLKLSGNGIRIRFSNPTRG